MSTATLMTESNEIKALIDLCLFYLSAQYYIIWVIRYQRSNVVLHVIPYLFLAIATARFVGWYQ